MGKCPHCKKVPYPVRDENGKIIVKNLFKIDFLSVVFIIILLFLSWAYQQDMQKAGDVLKNPANFCNTWCVKNRELAYYNMTDTITHIGGYYKLPESENGTKFLE